MTGLGAFGEAYAVGYLSRLGYQILERNVRYRVGELDIVAREAGELVFVEVKCRRSAHYGLPEEAITGRRYRHLDQAIHEYLSRHQLEPDAYRIDLVAIVVGASGRVQRCEVLRNVEAPRP